MSIQVNLLTADTSERVSGVYDSNDGALDYSPNNVYVSCAWCASSGAAAMVVEVPYCTGC
jgi:hypothetical protein